MDDEEILRLNPGHFIEKFYRGTIIKLRRGAQTGLVRSTATGRVLPFAFLHVRLLGDARSFGDLREGMVVGYDVSWTEKGTMVSSLWVPPRPRTSPPPSEPVIEE